MMRLSGSVEVALRLGIGSPMAAPPVCPALAAFGLGAAVPFQLRATLFLRRLLASASSAAIACWIFGPAVLLVASPSPAARRHACPCRKSRLFAIRSLRAANMRATSAFNSASRFSMRS